MKLTAQICSRRHSRPKHIQPFEYPDCKICLSPPLRVAPLADGAPPTICLHIIDAGHLVLFIFNAGHLVLFTFECWQKLA